MTSPVHGSRLLYVSAFAPCENAGHAGAHVAHENLRALQSRNMPVDVLVCTTEQNVKPLHGAQVFMQSRAQLLWHVLRHASSLGAAAICAAPLLHTRLNRQAEAALVHLLLKHDYAEVFVDFTQAVLLTQRAIRRAQRSVPLTACLHDVWAQRFLRSRRLADATLAGLVMREEQRLLLGLDKAVVLSIKDRDLLTSLYAIRDIAVKPFVSPAWTRHVHRRPEGIDPQSLIFFANFERRENASAARWFVDHALDPIRAAQPMASLLLVGTASDRLARQLARDGVRGTGFVEDPSAHFSRCACAIAPLAEGAGVKFKVLEALACGVPVIGTPVACEGIEPQPMLTCAPLDRFAEAVAARLS
jgi:glycosyltransferase involved in cell wall biosynthesis